MFHKWVFRNLLRSIIATFLLVCCLLYFFSNIDESIITVEKSGSADQEKTIFSHRNAHPVNSNCFLDSV